MINPWQFETDVPTGMTIFPIRWWIANSAGLALTIPTVSSFRCSQPRA
jgi:hypothetical protein